MHNLKEIRKDYSKFEKDLEKRSVKIDFNNLKKLCLLYTSPSPRDKRQSRMPSSA